MAQRKRDTVAVLSLRDFASLDSREARRKINGALPAGYRGSFAVKPSEYVR